MDDAVSQIKALLSELSDTIPLSPNSERASKAYRKPQWGATEAENKLDEYAIAFRRDPGGFHDDERLRDIATIIDVLKKVELVEADDTQSLIGDIPIPFGMDKYEHKFSPNVKVRTNTMGEFSLELLFTKPTEEVIERLEQAIAIAKLERPLLGPRPDTDISLTKRQEIAFFRSLEANIRLVDEQQQQFYIDCIKHHFKGEHIVPRVFDEVAALVAETDDDIVLLKNALERAWVQALQPLVPYQDAKTPDPTNFRR